MIKWYDKDLSNNDCPGEDFNVGHQNKYVK